jgi:hypothetical protein
MSTAESYTVIEQHQFISFKISLLIIMAAGLFSLTHQSFGHPDETTSPV